MNVTISPAKGLILLICLIILKSATLGSTVTPSWSFSRKLLLLGVLFGSNSSLAETWAILVYITPGSGGSTVAL